MQFFAVSYLILAEAASAAYLSQAIWQAPNGTWLENLAVRADGSILATVLTKPELWLVQPDPSNPNAQLIHSFDAHTGLTGITETFPNTFEVVASNFTMVPPACIAGSSRIYRVSFPRNNNDTKPKVSLTSHSPHDIGLPNGLLRLNKHTLLLADSIKGVIWAIDTITRTSRIVIQDPLLRPMNGSLGVNGLKLHGCNLFFTNEAQSLFGQFEIDTRSGIPKSAARMIAHNKSIAAADFDDFALSPEGCFAYVTAYGGNNVVKIDVATGVGEIIAGGNNSSQVLQPTAAAFGRNGGEGTLFVTTAGGVGGGGRLLAIHVGGVN